MNDWIFEYDGFDAATEGQREALCTLGNGYFCTRGAGTETRADGVHYPGTYVAGLYDRLTTHIAGRDVANEDLVNVPNWLAVELRFADGPWFDLAAVELLEYRQRLDLKRGVLERQLRFRDGAGRESTLAERRLVHMGRRHLAALEITATAENWSGSLQVRASLEGRIVNAGVERYKALASRHLEPVESAGVGEEAVFLRVRAVQSRVEIAQAARLRLFAGGEAVTVPRALVTDEGYAGHELSLELAQGAPLRIEKVVSLYTSRDQAISECGLAAREAVHRAGGFDDLLATHVRAWERLWRRCDIELTPGGREQVILRLNVFHLLQTTSPNTIDLDVGVPARGWHGEAYRGHIFWDEVFILPYLTFRLPDVARSLLMYRFRRLDEARWNAAQAGFKGAMFPWQSGSDGQEESQSLHLNPRSGRWLKDNSSLQRHVNAAIAYNVWHYVVVTNDYHFLNFYGAELLLEIARFWSSLASFNAELERYEIRGVMGPDEYHDGYPWAEEPGLDNNSYTNLMAVWVLSRALDTLELLAEERRAMLCARLSLGDAELARWRDIAARMRVVFHDGDLISQFEGYDRLEEFDWAGHVRKYGDVRRLDRILEAENDTPNRYKLSKQADVMMLFYLFSAAELAALFAQLGYVFDSASIPRNVEYYLRRTSHGSSLSYVVHAWVMSRSDRASSWRFCCEALATDVNRVQGDSTTPEGIHLGAMAGTVDIIQRAYTGLEVRQDLLRLNPCLPENLKAVRQRLRYRGHEIDIEITSTHMRIGALKSRAAPVQIQVDDTVKTLVQGETLEITL